MNKVVMLSRRELLGTGTGLFAAGASSLFLNGRADAVRPVEIHPDH